MKIAIVLHTGILICPLYPVHTIPKNVQVLILISRSAHRTTNFMNPEFQFPQFKVLQSVFIFFILAFFDIF